MSKTDNKIHNWVSHVETNKETMDESYIKLKNIGLSTIRSIYKQMRALVKEYGYKNTANILIPELEMSYGELAAIVLIKKHI